MELLKMLVIDYRERGEGINYPIDMKTLKDEINAIKKATLHFDLLELKEDTTPKLDTYFGGKPYITDEKEIQYCTSCNKKMEFIFQMYMPVMRSNVKKLYSFYYCFDCVKTMGEATYAINIYTNPTEKSMVSEVDYESVVPYCDVKFFPVYEIPDWEYCEQSNPDFIRKIENLYGDKAYDVYIQMEQRVREHFDDTGYKLKGYPLYFDYEEIPLCPHSKVRMEPFIQMENIPELNLNWLNKDSYIILFKSPFYDEFVLRTIDLESYDENLLADDEYDDADDDISEL